MNQSTDTGANERNVEFDPKVFRSGKNSKRKSSGKEEKHKVLDTLSIETVRKLMTIRGGLQSMDTKEASSLC